RGADAHLDGLAALPLFLSVRAAIRAKALAAGLAHLDGAAARDARRRLRRYFAAASLFLRTTPPCLVAIGGLSGTGKTTLAARLAPRIGGPPGAVHLRSDVERKRLAGVGETHRLPPETYTRESASAVYARLNALAGRALAAGRSVVLDAVHAQPHE